MGGQRTLFPTVNGEPSFAASTCVYARSQNFLIMNQTKSQRGGRRKNAGRKTQWLTKCILMAVQVTYACSEATARRRLDAFSWRYEKVLSKSDAEILDEWDDLSLFGQGYEVGFRTAELMDMKRRKGLK